MTQRWFPGLRGTPKTPLLRGTARYRHDRSRLLLVVVLTALFGHPHTGYAQARAPAPKRGASDEYAQASDRGLAAFKQKQYVEARALFTRAHALQPSARTLRALGLTDFALDDYTLSARELSAALTHPNTPLDAEQRREVEDLLAWMHTSLGSAQLEYLPLEASAMIDDKPVQAGEVLLTPGTHRLRVSAPGWKTHDESFEIALSPMPQALHVHLSANAVAAPGAVAQTPNDAAAATRVHNGVAQQPSTAWLFIGGGGLVMLAAGGTLFGLGRVDVDEVETPGPPYESPSHGEAQRARGRWLTGTGIVLGALGIAGISTALVLRATQTPREHAPEAWSFVVSPTQLGVTRHF